MNLLRKFLLWLGFRYSRPLLWWRDAKEMTREMYEDDLYRPDPEV